MSASRLHQAERLEALSVFLLLAAPAAYAVVQRLFA